MDVEQLKEDVRQGRIEADRLVELVVTLQQQLQAAQRRIEELEQQVDSSAAQVEDSFSVEAEEQRQAARKKTRRRRKRPSRRGRIKKAEKLACAVRTETVYPATVPQQQCRFSHTRVVWRLENHQAVLVAYDIYRGPGHQYGQIPGVLGRSEFGLEIVVAIAYLVYMLGLSFDKVCLLMRFFENLPLKKSQLDALLNQLARHWESEFDRLCLLLANSAVVHADETSWSLNSVWGFLSEKVRVLFFGVPKDAETLQQILDPQTFPGILISDDAAVYAHFPHAQKCWAHLLRKAIKLTLLEPDNAEYRRFTDRLLEIYRTACRVQRDRRFGPAGRARKVGELDDEILALCGPMWCAELPPLAGPADDYRLLCNELMRLMLAQQLFTFVTAPPVQMPQGETMAVAGTNNEVERTLRSSAEARKTGRTTKTPQGARRRTILVSILESLRQHLPSLTLSAVTEEIRRWLATGQSVFAELLRELQLPPPRESLLDRLFPAPSR